jgi:hypothetical protein
MTHTFWQRLLGRKSSTVASSRLCRNRRIRPNLEPLEDRINPSTFTATNTAQLIADINTLNASGGGTIILAANTDFKLTGPDSADGSFWYGPAGLPAISSAITITGSGGDVIDATAATTANPFRIFYVSGGLAGELGAGNLTLQNVELVGGVAEGGSSGSGGGGVGAGGAIFNQGTLTLNAVTITGAEALGGSSGVGSASGGGGIGANATGTTGGGFGGTLSGTATFGGSGAAGTTGTGGGGGGGFQNTDNATVPGTLAGGAGAGAGKFGGAGGLGTGGEGGAAGDGGGGGASNKAADVGGTGGNFGFGGTAGTGGGGGGGVGGGGAAGADGGGGGGGFGGGGGAARGAGNTAGNGGFGGGGGAGLGGGNAGAGRLGGGAGGATLGGGGAGLGGAIFNMGASNVAGSGVLNLVNTTLTGNTAQGGSGFQGGAGEGGGLFSLDGNVTLTYATIAGNTIAAGASNGGAAGVADGDAVYNQASGNLIQNGRANAAQMAVQNTILADPPVVGIHDLVNDAQNAGVNNVGNNTDFSGFTSLTENGITNAGGGAHNASGAPITVIADPLLTPLGNFGGPVPLLALQVGSPAIAAGTGTSVDPNLPTTDARGVARPDTDPDIGAYQSATTTSLVNFQTLPNIRDTYTPFSQTETVQVQVLEDNMPVTTGLVSITDANYTQIVGLDANGDAVATFIFPFGKEVPGAHQVTATYLPDGVSTVSGPDNSNEFFQHLTNSITTTAPNTYFSYLLELLIDASLFGNLFG